MRLLEGVRPRAVHLSDGTARVALASALCYAADELLVLDGPPEFVGDDFVAVVVGM